MMKYLAIMLMCFALNLNAQYILNGSFENFNYEYEWEYFEGGCVTGLSNSAYNFYIQNSTAFGNSTQGIMPDTCSDFYAWGGIPQHGEYQLLMGRKLDEIWEERYSAISLELSDTLTEGEWYKLSFYMKKPPPPTSEDDDDNVKNNIVDIGLSTYPDAFGLHIFTSELPQYDWGLVETVFQAPADIKHITCIPVLAPKKSFIEKNSVFLDNFVLSTDTTLSVSVQELHKPKQLLRIVDVLGRESKPQLNVPLFYIYDDGTVEKKIVVSD